MDTPYDSIAVVPSFTITSDDVEHEKEMGMAQVSGIMGAGGQDVSPQLAWADFPEETRSFAITVYDPDAPTASGFWHWAIANVPVSTTSLPTDAGNETGTGLPPDAWQLKNDAGLNRYLGAAPPAGHGPHTYYIAVHALDVASLDIDKDATPAFLAFNMSGHTIARAVIAPWWAAK